MNLFIRQAVFSWTDRFAILDEQGGDRYYVEGEFFSWGKKLHVYDLAGNECAFLRQRVLSLLPRFEVFRDETMVAEIVKEFSLLHPRYSVEGPGWNVEGSFLAHDYEILDAEGSVVVTIHKVWMSWGDCYELDIARDADEILALSVVLAIDCATASEDTAFTIGT